MGNPETLLQALRERLAAPVRLFWTANRTVYLSLRPAGVTWTLRLHECFREAPAPVWAAVESFLSTGNRRWLEPARAHFSMRAASAPARSRPPRTRVRGRTHHLGEIVEEVRSQGIFAGLPPVAITWGRRVRPGRRHLRLGSYRAGPPAVIRVHPVLDDRRVPRYVVAQVVHHELVHHCLGHRFGAAQGRTHGRAFQELDAVYADGARAQAWQERHLGGLLAARRR